MIQKACRAHTHSWYMCYTTTSPPDPLWLCKDSLPNSSTVSTFCLLQLSVWCSDTVVGSYPKHTRRLMRSRTPWRTCRASASVFPNILMELTCTGARERVGGGRCNDVGFESLTWRRRCTFTLWNSNIYHYSYMYSHTTCMWPTQLWADCFEGHATYCTFTVNILCETATYQ